MNSFFNFLWSPVAKFTYPEILLILGFALMFDFFLQFFFRFVVIIIARIHIRLVSLYEKNKNRAAIKIAKQIVQLEAQLDRLEQKNKATTKTLKRLAALRKSQRSQPQINIVNRALNEPPVSIIIPCHNSVDVIENTLKHIVELDYTNKEILVIDDGSTDSTVKVASKFCESIKIIRRDESSGKKTGAINFGLAFAAGDIVVAIDDDTIVEKTSLRDIIAPLKDSEDVAAVGGNVRVLNSKKNILTQLQSIEYLIIMQLVKPFQAFLYRAVLIISGSYGAFYKKYLLQIGGWDSDIITEDLDLTWKLYRLRKRVLHAENSVCYTEVPSDIKTLIRQRNRWDFGLFETLSKHKNFLFSRRFPTLGFGLLPETIFFEVFSVIARPVYFLIVLFIVKDSMAIFLLILYFYLALEILIIIFVGLLSSDKRFCFKAVFAPVMLVYHQLLAVVRIRALYRYLTGKGIKW